MTEFNFGTRVLFETGAARHLGAELTSLGVVRPLMVTDAGLVNAGLPATVLAQLPRNTYPTLFDQTPENPTEAAVEVAADLYAKAGCDGVVGLGGGSPMDLAKALVVRVSDGQPILRRAFHVCGWNAPPLSVTPPLVLMPTTAGTGSEVGRGAVLMFRDGKKSGLLCQGVVRLALCDPELSYGLPSRLTAATGLDAISHCIETYCSPAYNPIADAIALDGLTRLVANIERATENGNDAHARSEMMLGALEGGLTFQKGVGPVHALSHSLGATGAHHGLLNAVLIPHVLAWNAPALELKLSRMRQVLCLAESTDMATYFAQLCARLRLPRRLRDLDIRDEDLPAYAQQATTDSSQSNPRAMQEPDYLAVLRAAW
jgi:4-hydroxybutyrate dehydrogenase